MLALLLLCIGFAGRATVIALRGEPPRSGGPGMRMRTAPPGPISAADKGAFTIAEARAYALLGMVADGDLPSMPTLDDELAEACIRMRKVLERQRIVAGANRPTVTPGGTLSIPARRIPLTPVPETRVANGSTSSSPQPDAVSAPVVAVGADQVGHDLNFVAQPGSVTLTPDGQVIRGRGVWAAVTAEPGVSLPMRITDQGEGGYVIALYGPDFGTVRVNGGVVVPGRFYLIQGTMDISAEVPVNIHIRPLSAVPDYHPEPALTPPSANG